VQTRGADTLLTMPGEHSGAASEFGSQARSAPVRIDGQQQCVFPVAEPHFARRSSARERIDYHCAQFGVRFTIGDVRQGFELSSGQQLWTSLGR
jgi:hypothetical protein